MSPSPYQPTAELRRSARIQSRVEAAGQLEQLVNNLAGVSNRSRQPVRASRRQTAANIGPNKSNAAPGATHRPKRAADTSNERASHTLESSEKEEGEKTGEKAVVGGLACRGALDKRRAALKLKEAHVNKGNGSAHLHRAQHRPHAQKATLAKARSSVHVNGLVKGKTSKPPRAALQKAKRPAKQPTIKSLAGSPPVTPQGISTPPFSPVAAPATSPQRRAPSPSPCHRAQRLSLGAQPPSPAPRRPAPRSPMPSMRVMRSNTQNVLGRPLPSEPENDGEEEMHVDKPSTPAPAARPTPSGLRSVEKIDAWIGQRLPRASEILGKLEGDEAVAVEFLDLAARHMEHGNEQMSLDLHHLATRRVGHDNMDLRHFIDHFGAKLRSVVLCDNLFDYID